MKQKQKTLLLKKLRVSLQRKLLSLLHLDGAHLFFHKVTFSDLMTYFHSFLILHTQHLFIS